MITVEQIEHFYSYFYSKKYSDPKYRFNRTKTTESVCNSFLKIIDKAYSLHSVGEGFLWEYFLFQFQYWHDLTLQNQFTDKVAIAFIVGKKAFQRWHLRDTDYDWQIDTYPIIKEYGVDKKDVFKKQEHHATNDYSKHIRKLYLNTEKGLVTCIDLTTLYDPMDLSCIKCNSRKECKELLRVNFPQLYTKRSLLIAMGNLNGS